MNPAPLWVQITLGVVPILAAIVTGIFLLTNTVTRRIERLKTLVDINKDYPEVMFKDFIIESLIVRELYGIQKALTPEYRMFGRQSVALLISAPIVLVLQLIPPIQKTPIPLIASTVFFIGTIVAVIQILRKRRKVAAKIAEYEYWAGVREGYLHGHRDRKRDEFSERLENRRKAEQSPEPDIHSEPENLTNEAATGTTAPEDEHEE